MGLAKYFEDNNEIILERQREMDERDARCSYIQQTRFPLGQDQTFKSEKSARFNKKPLPKFRDEYILCQCCGTEFLFSAKSQSYYKHKGWGKPKRCKECRELNKIRYLMYSFH